MESSTELAGRRVLVTGASGMVGSHVVGDLLARGALVTAFDLRAYDAGPSGPPAERLRVLTGDVTDREAVAPLVEDVDAVVHLAAILRIAAEESPSRAFDINLGATHQLLELGAEHGVERIVLGSSIGVYGAPPNADHVFTEDDPQVGRSFYEVSKIAAELYAEAFHRSRGLTYVPLRLGTLYGPGMARTGVIPRLLHDVVDAVDAGRTPRIELAPDTTYDFLYVGDAAESVVRSLTTTLTDQPINVVSGVSTTLNELVTTLLKVEGASIEPIWAPDDSLLPAARQFDPSRIRDTLGFVPSTSVEDGLRAFSAWRRRNPSP